MDIDEYVAIPVNIFKLHNFVTLAAYAIFVNGTALLITSSSKTKFVTIEHVPNCAAYQISNALNIVIKLYGQVGFIVHAILTDI